MHPYKINCYGDIEYDGMIFTSDKESRRYYEDTERAEEYWAKQEEREREDRLLDLEEKFRIRFDI